MIKVVMFTGGESIDESNEFKIQEWSSEAVTELIASQFSDWDLNIDVNMFSDPIAINDTLTEAIPGKIFQGVKSSDGGEIYVVNVS